VIWIVCVLGIVGVFHEEWPNWPNSPGEYDFAFSGGGHWHERVQEMKETLGFFRFHIHTTKYVFSVNRFLTSSSGWCVILLFVGMLATFALDFAGYRAFVRLRRKTGSTFGWWTP
jgi:hypothetical protein